jgi:hypothetical protein
MIMSWFILSSCQFSKKTSTRLYKEASKDKFDIIIVPGVQFENGKWDRIMKGRVYWAKHLYDRGIAKNIMFSGSAVYSPYYEGEIMALYAQKLGIPKENIYTETKAEHSTENIYYSYKKARKLGFSKIALASDPFQTKLLRRFTKKKVSRDIKLIPFVIDTLKVIEPDMTDPQIDYAKAYVSDFVSIIKRESRWKRFKGTLGWRRDKKAYDSLPTSN